MLVNEITQLSKNLSSLPGPATEKIQDPTILVNVSNAKFDIFIEGNNIVWRIHRGLRYTLN